MRFTVLRSKTVSRKICDKKHQPPLVNYMPYNTSMGNAKFNVSDASRLLFPLLFEGSKHGSSYRLGCLNLK